LLCWALTNALRVALAINTSQRKRATEGRPAVVDGIPVVVTDAIGPATVGFWHSQVLVPRWVLALPAAQRQYVLRHEEEHRARYDAQILFVASLPLILAPWNLALWWQLRRLYLAVEIDCDNRVVNRLGNANAYGDLLLKVAQATSRGPRLQPALLGGTGSLERRLTALLDPTPLRQIQRLLLPAFALGLLAVVLMVPHPVLERAPHSHATPTTVISSQPTPRR
jgi:beta-lactamase regulating signal transducer with metallopeptidase domain